MGPQAVIGEPARTQLDFRVRISRPDEFVWRCAASGRRNSLSVDRETDVLRTLPGNRSYRVGQVRLHGTVWIDGVRECSCAVPKCQECRIDGDRGIGFRRELRALTRQQVLKVGLVKCPKRPLLRLEDSIHLLKGCFYFCVWIERILACDFTEL